MKKQKSKTIVADSLRMDSLVSATAVIPDRQHKGATVRFNNGLPCCTCTYNYSMSHDEQRYLAKRIAAALNAVRGMSLDEIEELSHS